MAQPTHDGEAFTTLLQQMGMYLAVQPKLSGAPWKPVLGEDRKQRDFYVYAKNPAAFATVSAYRTAGGRVFSGTNSHGETIYCQKLDRDKIPEDLDLASYERSALNSEDDVLHPITKLPPQRYHALLPGGKHLLVLYMQRADETSVLDQLNTAGLFMRGQPKGTPQFLYKDKSAILAIEVPEGLMQTMLRTEDNGILELSSVLQEALNEGQRQRLEAGALKKPDVLKLALEHLRPREKSQPEGKRAKVSDEAATRAKPYLLADHLETLRAQSLSFASRRLPNGDLQPLLQGVTDKTKNILGGATDGIDLRSTMNRSEMALSPQDAELLKTLLGAEYYQQREDIHPFCVQNNFWGCPR